MGDYYTPFQGPDEIITPQVRAHWGVIIILKAESECYAALCPA